MINRPVKWTARDLLLMVAILIAIAAAGFAFLRARLMAATQEVASFELSDTTAGIGLPREINGRAANLLSAFHGLDTLPRPANLICRGAEERGGMPVIFPTEIDVTTMQAGDFRVTTSSGKAGAIHCVSLMPAIDPGELRTVLLIGELGHSASDPPERVDIVGNLHDIDGTLNHRGASIPVIPLADGPSLALAEVVEDWTEVGTLGPHRARGSLCPSEGTVQAIRVTWQGGVTLPDGDEPGDTERDLYTILVERPDGTRREVTPAALADLGDNDNNHTLCLDTNDRPISLSFPAGILTDPNGDLNPATGVNVTPASGR